MNTFHIKKINNKNSLNIVNLKGFIKIINNEFFQLTNKFTIGTYYLK